MTFLVSGGSTKKVACMMYLTLGPGNICEQPLLAQLGTREAVKKLKRLCSKTMFMNGYCLLML